MKKFSLLLILMILSIFKGFAQDIEVKKFELMVKNETSAMSPRKDINGTLCGLVKV